MDRYRAAVEGVFLAVRLEGSQERYVEVLLSVAVRIPEDWRGDAAWEFVQRLCMLVVAPSAASFGEDLLLPLRMLLLLPVEWRPVVLESVSNLGFEAFLLPGLTAP